jgi:hypothetical protein
MRALLEREPQNHVTPHELPSKFLLRVWAEDCSPALVFLDQQEILRPMLWRIC